MAKQPSKRSRGAGEAVLNPVPAQQIETSLPVGNGDGNASGSLSAGTKQPRCWKEHVTLIEETIRNSGRIATQLHGDFEGKPERFSVDGYGLALHPSEEIKIIYTDGSSETI